MAVADDPRARQKILAEKQQAEAKLKAGGGFDDVELRQELERVAETHPDPSLRQRASAAIAALWPQDDQRDDREGVGKVEHGLDVDKAEYRQHLAEVATKDPDPERRLRAAALLDEEVFSD